MRGIGVRGELLSKKRGSCRWGTRLPAFLPIGTSSRGASLCGFLSSAYEGNPQDPGLLLRGVHLAGVTRCLLDSGGPKDMAPGGTPEREDRWCGCIGRRSSPLNMST